MVRSVSEQTAAREYCEALICKKTPVSYHSYGCKGNPNQNCDAESSKRPNHRREVKMDGMDDA
jgi:hypothetical protein